MNPQSSDLYPERIPEPIPPEPSPRSLHLAAFILPAFILHPSSFILPRPSSFILHPSSFRGLHPSEAFILPAFILTLPGCSSSAPSGTPSQPSFSTVPTS
ncbi:MAG: hypothetical protein ACXW5U_00515 [Thermoanaerobaculia bacterium]